MYLAVMSFGFASMAIQIVLMRELMVVFYGNELSAGIILASWLLWVSLGSLIPNKLLDHLENKTSLKNTAAPLFHILLVSIGFAAPFTIYLIRSSRNILSALAGEMIGLFPMTVLSFFLLAPVCFIFGSLFAVSCRLAAKNSAVPGEEIGKVYLWEAVGAAAGGLFFNFALVYMFTPLQTAFLCGAIAIASVLFITDKNRTKMLWFATLLAAATVLFFTFFGAAKLDFSLRKAQWGRFTLISSTDSRYGNIALTKRGSQLNLFENGLLVASTDDPLTAEESVHYALLEHPNPKKILLIGGSLTGALNEVLRHPVEAVDCVELDPGLIKTGKDSYPREILKAFADPRVTINYIDGRLFVKKSAGKKNVKYDVVILALPNPFTAQINRFYSLEFYREVNAVIDAKGVFSFGVVSSENYISPVNARFLNSLYLTLKNVFEDVKILPGDNNYFFACPSLGILTYDYGLILKRSRARNLELKYVNEYYLPSKFEPERIKYLENTIRSAEKAKINRDFRPIGYFYDMALWSTRSRFGPWEILNNLGGITAGEIAFALIAIFFVLLPIQLKSRKLKDLAVILSVGTTGLSGMLLQIAIILSFQVLYGYVYQKIGLIFASFMLGLVIGALSAVRILKKNTCLYRIYNSAQLSLSAYSVILPVVFVFLGQNIIAQTLFPFLPVAAGFISGLQFPLANSICLSRKEYAGKTAGFLYAIDLAGACAGALVTSAILIPVIGINAACYLTGLMNFLVLLLLLARRGQLVLSRT